MVEKNIERHPTSGLEVYDEVIALEVTFGRNSRQPCLLGRHRIRERRAYSSDHIGRHFLQHNVGVMHVEKNVCDMFF